MKTLKILPVLLVIGTLISLSPNEARAQAGPGEGKSLGIGAMIGEPSGITIKAWNNERTAFTIGAAWSIFTEDADMHVLVDYKMHSWLGEDMDERRTAFYYGLGGRVIFADDPVIGARVPIGLNFLFPELPIGLFVEGAPVLDITPDVDLQGNALAGIRLYF